MPGLQQERARPRVLDRTVLNADGRQVPHVRDDVALRQRKLHRRENRRAVFVARQPERALDAERLRVIDVNRVARAGPAVRQCLRLAIHEPQDKRRHSLRGVALRNLAAHRVHVESVVTQPLEVAVLQPQRPFAPEDVNAVRIGGMERGVVRRHADAESAQRDIGRAGREDHAHGRRARDLDILQREPAHVGDPERRAASARIPQQGAMPVRDRLNRCP